VQLHTLTGAVGGTIVDKQYFDLPRRGILTEDPRQEWRDIGRLIRVGTITVRCSGGEAG
jgi:hypothetical protein